MKIAVLSDVHGNLLALNRVVEEADDKGAEEFWCLGDVMGYGPRPLQCWEQLRGLDIPRTGWVAGNNDWGLVGRLEARFFKLGLTDDEPYVLAGDFSEQVWRTILQQRQVLRHRAELVEHIKALPVLASPLAGVYLAHGWFNGDPDRSVTIYLRTTIAAEEGWQFLQTQYALLGAPQSLPELAREAQQGWRAPRLMIVGHTHVPCIWRRRQGRDVPEAAWESLPVDNGPVHLRNLDRWPVLLNPGSVGFPRDGKPEQPSFALLDWEGDQATVEICRVTCAVEEVKRQMKEVGVDPSFIKRLLE